MKPSIKEMDKAIGEFMGYKCYEYHNPFVKQKDGKKELEIYFYKGNISKNKLEELAEDYPLDMHSGKLNKLKTFSYNTNWNDLMSVVEKLRDEEIEFSIVDILQKLEDNSKRVLINKKEVHRAVYEFIIKMQNENKH